MGLVGIVLVLVGYLSFYRQTSNTVGFRISTEKSQYIVGEDITLYYDIVNNQRMAISNINLTYNIRNATQPITIPIKVISAQSTEKGFVKLSTIGLKKGDYQLFSEITYNKPTANKSEHIILTLNFALY